MTLFELRVYITSNGMRGRVVSRKGFAEPWSWRDSWYNLDWGEP